MIPILMFHRVADVPGDRNSTSPELFERELDYLAEHGYATISLKTLYQSRRDARPLPHKSVVLTFDDGSLDIFTEGLPRLLARGMTATVFPVADLSKAGAIYSGGRQPTRTMSLAQLGDWRDAGMEIGSHGLHHRDLTELTRQECIEELSGSKKFFEDALQCPIEFFCYPYGGFSADIASETEKAGYLGALAISENLPFGGYSDYAMPRLISSGRQPFWEFKLKISYGFRPMLLSRTLEYRVRKLRKKLLGR